MSDHMHTRSTENTPAAAEVYQDWLDTTSRLLMAGDVAGFAAHTARPYAMRTREGETIFETDADILADIQPFIASLHALDVTHYIRLVRKARFLNPEMIEGFHTTYTLRNAVTVVPSYLNRMVMRRFDDGVWRVIEAEHDLAHQNFPVADTQTKLGAFDTKWAEMLSDIRCEYVDARPLYQAYLSSMDSANNASDYDGWLAHFTFPHTLHFEQSDLEIADRDDLRTVFAALARMAANAGADRIARRADRAEFVASDRVIGYHDLVALRGDRVVAGPIKSRMIVTLQDGAWRATSVSNAAPHELFSAGPADPQDYLPTLREIQKRMSQ